MVQGRQRDTWSAWEGPPGAVLASGAGEGPAPPAGPPALLCLQVHAHQDVFHILIKAPPRLAGPLTAGSSPSSTAAVA